jgi:hypothetical protein
MNRSATIVLVGAVVLCEMQALAGPLAIDTTSMAGWHGSTPYANAYGLIGAVEFAVWAPGTFPVGNFAGYIPTPGDYVYTYQAFETGAAALSEVGVRLVGPADPLNIGDFTGNNGFGPVAGSPSISASLYPFDSANWLFDAIFAGGSTDGLAFSSPNAPSWAKARNVDDGTVAFAIPVPSPQPDNVPEPGTWTLALLACAGAALLRRRRKEKHPVRNEK